jgi:hypothetical protein
LEPGSRCGNTLKENEAEIFEEIKGINRGRFSEKEFAQRMRALSLPTAEREALKRKLGIQLQADSLSSLRDRAKRLYQSLTGYLEDGWWRGTGTPFFR